MTTDGYMTVRSETLTHEAGTTPFAQSLGVMPGTPVQVLDPVPEPTRLRVGDLIREVAPGEVDPRPLARRLGVEAVTTQNSIRPGARVILTHDRVGGVASAARRPRPVRRG